MRKQLKEEAKHRNITLNSLINAILAKYIFFDKIVEGMNAIPLSGAFFRELVWTLHFESAFRLSSHIGPVVCPSRGI